jgi:hypothetical protein
VFGPSSDDFHFSHGDLHEGNILIDPQSGAITGVIDWLLAFVPCGQRSFVLGGLKRITIDSYLALETLITSAKIPTLRIWSYEHSFAPNCIRPLYYRAFLEASNSVLSSMPQWILLVLKEKQISFLIGITGWDIGGRIAEVFSHGI